MDTNETYIPFVTKDYDALQTIDGNDFYVKREGSTLEAFTLFKNTAENNRVDKTQYLTEVGTIEGVFRDEASVTNFAINIEYPKFIDFNYVYVPVFNRYYYVTDVTVVRTGLYEISLSVDVLMSYRDAILKLYAFIDRNEYTYDSLIVDRNRVIKQGYDIQTTEIPNSIFKDTVGGYLITGLGFDKQG